MMVEFITLMMQVTLSDRNTGYNVSQFYSVALHPDSGSQYVIGGTQDNGTWSIDGTGIQSGNARVGGDGAYTILISLIRTTNLQLQHIIIFTEVLMAGNLGAIMQIMKILLVVTQDFLLTLQQLIQLRKLFILR